MTKKLIIIATIINLFLISCKSDSTFPFDIEYFILLFGGGSVIEKEKAITDPTQISSFIEEHNGIYYSKYEDESLDLRYIIENDKIYTGYGTEVTGTRTLFGTKLQIYIPGKTTGGSGYDKNDEMFTFNFATNQNIYLFANAIFHKETYAAKQGYNYKIGEAIEELKQYSGDYYYYGAVLDN